MTERIEDLRQRVVDLTAQEKGLLEEQQVLQGQLADLRAKLEHVKATLIEEAKRDTRLRHMQESARATVIRLHMFTDSELVAELGDKTRAKKILAAMLCEKPPLLKIGRLGTRKLYEYVGEIKQVPRDAIELERDRVANALERLRDWVVNQEGVFTPAQAAFAAEVDRTQALQSLRALADLGIVSDQSPAADRPMFAYNSATVSDLAAQRDAKTARQRAASVAVAGEQEIAGTGKKISVSNKELQALINAALKAGATVSHAANGHFAVEYEGMRRVLISSTPRNARSVMNDRARLRKAGIAV